MVRHFFLSSPPLLLQRSVNVILREGNARSAKVASVMTKYSIGTPERFLEVTQMK